MADLMTPGIAVYAAQPAIDVATLAARHGLARVPVVNKTGRPAGMAGPVEVLAALRHAGLAAMPPAPSS